MGFVTFALFDDTLSNSHKKNFEKLFFSWEISFRTAVIFFMVRSVLLTVRSAITNFPSNCRITMFVLTRDRLNASFNSMTATTNASRSSRKCLISTPSTAPAHSAPLPTPAANHCANGNNGLTEEKKRAEFYSMIHLDCNISWRHRSKSNRDSLILKKRLWMICWFGILWW